MRIASRINFSFLRVIGRLRSLPLINPPSGTAVSAMPQFGGVWTAAPTNKRMAPSATRARPGQFLLSPKPAPGRRGSRVRAAAVAERDLLPLSRARQIGGPAMRSTPLATSSAPSQNMISILAAFSRRVRPLVSKLLIRLPSVHCQGNRS
jgi:hypothetical protein